MRSTFRLMFYINRNKVKSDGTTAILCRISIDGRKSAVTTGIYCKPSDWDSNKGEIRMNKENNRLTAFRGITQSYRIKYRFHSGIPAADRRGRTGTA